MEPTFGLRRDDPPLLRKALEAYCAASLPAEMVQEKLPPVFFSFAPGRINLIGEHVDYMGGSVFPASLTQGIVVLAARCRIRGLDRGQWLFVSSAGHPSVLLQHEDEKPKGGGWEVYIRGVVAEAAKLEGIAIRSLPSFLFFVHGDIPVGSGLSSSAALCVSLIYSVSWCAGNSMTVDHATQRSVPPLPIQQASAAKHPILVGAEVAKRARVIETDYCKVKVGIMDQFISVHGGVGSFIELDCASLMFNRHPLSLQCEVEMPGGRAQMRKYTLLLCNSMVKHKLGGQYNVIRSDMEAAQRIIAAHLQKSSFSLVQFAKEIEDASEPEPLKQFHHLFNSKTTYDRASYVVEEVLRCRKFIEVMRGIRRGRVFEKDPIAVTVGPLLTQTHKGLAQKLRISTPQIDCIHAAALSVHQCVGARLIGGGFGGCVLVVVQHNAATAAAASIKQAFASEYGKECEVYTAVTGRGAVHGLLSPQSHL